MTFVQLRKHHGVGTLHPNEENRQNCRDHEEARGWERRQQHGRCPCRHHCWSPEPQYGYSKSKSNIELEIVDLWEWRYIRCVHGQEWPDELTLMTAGCRDIICMDTWSFLRYEVGRETLVNKKQSQILIVVLWMKRKKWEESGRSENRSFCRE